MDVQIMGRRKSQHCTSGPAAGHRILMRRQHITPTRGITGTWNGRENRTPWPPFPCPSVRVSPRPRFPHMPTKRCLASVPNESTREMGGRAVRDEQVGWSGWWGSCPVVHFKRCAAISVPDMSTVHFSLIKMNRALGADPVRSYILKGNATISVSGISTVHLC